jgi:hypothetical protein
VINSVLNLSKKSKVIKIKMIDHPGNLPFLCLAATDSENLKRLQLPHPPVMHAPRKSARDSAKDSFERAR